jgi:hypothetical protein
MFQRLVVFGEISGSHGGEYEGDCVLELLYRPSDIVNTINNGRLRWAGHIHRMSSNDMPRRIMKSKPEGRSFGRSKLRWMVC